MAILVLMIFPALGPSSFPPIFPLQRHVTQVDALAIAIGTSHGAYKFSRPPTGDILAIGRVRQINQRIPNTHLVMHGSSSVPQELLKLIREFGGNIKETYGVPVEEIVEGIKNGVRKLCFIWGRCRI